MNYLRYEKVENKQVYEVYFDRNGKRIGSMILDISGDWYFDPEDNGGFFNWYALEELSRKLKELSLN